jgi:hypothetical protein
VGFLYFTQPRTAIGEVKEGFPTNKIIAAEIVGRWALKNIK